MHPPTPALTATVVGQAAVPAPGTIRQIVIVDGACERYADFVQSARRGDVGLHFCADGRSAIRLARRFRADAWLVSAELPDMPAVDLLAMLADEIKQSPTAAAGSGGARDGIFMLSDGYRPEDEQRALAVGVAGYLVQPVTLALIQGGDRPRDERRPEPLASA